MANVGSFLDKNLPGPALAILRAAGQMAVDHAAGADAAYLVGGPVRDMLIGIQPGDIDISVTADGPAFADALANQVGGTVTARSEFGTAKMSADELSIDVAMTRKETYARPGALPDVSPGTLTDDLARRDFTVNAMAIDITPSGWGELVDPNAGQRDIVLRRLRILHEKSFLDDPTRALRAIRYEARLGFTIDQGTLEQLQSDGHYLSQISSARIVAEIEHILDEPKRAAMLQRADDLGLLAAIHPALRFARAPREAIAQLDDNPGEELRLHAIALLATTLTESEAKSLTERLSLPTPWAEAVLAAPALKNLTSVLERSDLQPSEVVELLDPYPIAAIEAQLALAAPTLRRERLQQYLTRYRFIKPDSTGGDLLQLGVPQGPLIGELLRELRTGRLDRTIESRFEEEAHIKRRLPVLLGRESSG